VLDGQVQGNYLEGVGLRSRRQKGYRDRGVGGIEEEKVTVAADVAVLGLVTVHGLFCLNGEVGEV
jgi:hypothetical protein